MKECDVCVCVCVCVCVYEYILTLHAHKSTHPHIPTNARAHIHTQTTHTHTHTHTHMHTTHQYMNELIRPVFVHANAPNFFWIQISMFSSKIHIKVPPVLTRSHTHARRRKSCYSQAGALLKPRPSYIMLQARFVFVFVMYVCMFIHAHARSKPGSVSLCVPNCQVLSRPFRRSKCCTEHDTITHDGLYIHVKAMKLLVSMHGHSLMTVYTVMQAVAAYIDETF
jgi:hypothetical protein